MNRAIGWSLVTIGAVLAVGLGAEALWRRARGRGTRALVAAVAALAILAIVAAFFLWCARNSPLAFRG